jgi:transcriptional regulator with XRE-family HTH domain
VLFQGVTGPSTLTLGTEAAAILGTMSIDGSAGASGNELGQFLRARRAQVTPAEVGLPVHQGLRRTPGLRREELATLAGISSDYYVRLERGKETRPSAQVIDALARALRLDDSEHKHVRSLAALAARQPSEPPPMPSRSVPPGAKVLLESMRPNAVHIVGRNGDLLAWNPGGLRILAGIADWPARQRNVWRYLFLHPTARALFDDRDNQLRECVTYLRALSGLEPDARDLAQVVGELAVKSPEFVRLWDRYDVRTHTRSHKTFHHPEVGDLTLGYQSMQLHGTPGQALIAYYAEPGTPEYDALTLLDRSPHDEPQWFRADLHSPVSTETTPEPRRSD